MTLASVDGGHCALWLEPAFSLRALFPGQVATRLISYKDNTDCIRQLGHAVFAREDVLTSQMYFDGNAALRGADVLACQWVGECAKLRTMYSKPVIAYIPGTQGLVISDEGSNHGAAISALLGPSTGQTAAEKGCEKGTR